MVTLINDKPLKKLRCIQRSVDRHWVGNGFPVRTLFAYPNLGPVLTPFLLLDYAGRMEFSATTERRGVGEHPHRGFETVTIVYAGEVEHRDSSGGGGKIGLGDVQWMTAGAGLVHEEMHSPEFTKSGGAFEAIQLWVNLPARLKMTAPKYQTLLSKDIPELPLAQGAGKLRVIAGAFENAKGPAETFTPMNLWDVRLKGGHGFNFSTAEGHTAAVFVMKGNVSVNGQDAFDAEMVVLDR